jgi:hypothetical protein
MAIFPGSAIPSAATGYDIDNSVRYNSGDSPRLTRSVSSGSKRIFTMSTWIKHAEVASEQIWGAWQGTLSDANWQGLAWGSTGKLAFQTWNAGTTIATTALYRDPSAWYHVILAVDTNQSVAADRFKIYVNGDQVTSFSTETYPTRYFDYDAVADGEITIGTNWQGSAYYGFMDGYFAEFYFIDGTQYTASDFGETNEDTNQWIPKNASGLTFGTNGFYLKFQDSAALGDDSSGNTNDFTVTNLVATDQMLDTPTNNFATMNPVYIDREENLNITFSEGNLKWSSGGDSYGIGTIGVSTGKWYWEFYINSISADNNYFGAIRAGEVAQNPSFYYTTSTNSVRSTGQTDQTGVTGASNGDIVGVALNLDASPQTGAIYLNNVQLGSSMDLTSGTTWTPWLGNANPSTTKTHTLNCGQDSSFAGAVTAQGNQDANGKGDFYYSPPTDHLAVCTSNLPDPEIALPGEHFNTIVYDDGAGAKTGVGFQPDLVWFKSRGSAYDHKFVDAVRGVYWSVMSPDQAVQAEDTTGLTAFGADGFTVGADTDYSDTTGNGMVAWSWKGNGVSGGTLNENGNLDSQVNVNTTAGFSIATWTNNNTTGATVGHGLSQAPDLILNKTTTGTYSWISYHSGIDPTAPEDYFITINTTGARTDSAADGWNDTAPTATIFTLGQEGTNSVGGLDVVSYCWHSVEGYSKIGSYVGNGATEGPFIFTNFTPAYLLVKNAIASTNWRIYDNKRPAYNPENYVLYANSTAAPGTTGHPFDFLSNGAKVRGSWQDINTSGQTYIYAMFAASPFKTSNAR